MSDRIGNVENGSEGFKRAKEGIRELAEYPDIPVKEFEPQDIRDRKRAEQEEIGRNLQKLSEISEPNLSTVKTAKRNEKRIEEKQATKRNRFMLAVSAGLFSVASFFGLLKGVQHETPNFAGERQTPKREAEMPDEVTENMKANKSAGTDFVGLDHVEQTETEQVNANARDNMGNERDGDGFNPEDK